MDEHIDPSKFPDRLVVVAGTYDGVLAGWDSVANETDGATHDNEDKNKKDNLLDMLNSGMKTEETFLKMNFAMASHDGSVRSLSIASSEKKGTRPKSNAKDDDKDPASLFPHTMISCGFDESINIYSLSKQEQSGELKTPSDLGTPTCSSFAPPNEAHPTHVLIGLSTGKIVIYRKKDWSIQHILACHDEKGVNSIAVHPSGKMALSGGNDGKICLWDLMRGRLAFVTKVGDTKKGRKSTINDIIWSDDGKRYGYCTHEGNITAREMETGKDLLDINLPTSSKPNQICFVGGSDGLFLAAACNDGGLPLFAVGSVDDEDEQVGTRRALMAIEPVEGVATAGDERFKCIKNVNGGSGFLVVTANSGGIISLIDLEGAARMLLDDSASEEQSDDENSDADTESDSEDDDDEDVAAEILNSVRIGSGARITALSVWSESSLSKISSDEYESEHDHEENEDVKEQIENDHRNEVNVETNKNPPQKKRKVTTLSVGGSKQEIEMDDEALERARSLVSQAKKREKRKKGKQKNK